MGVRLAQVVCNNRDKGRHEEGDVCDVVGDGPVDGDERHREENARVLDQSGRDPDGEGQGEDGVENHPRGGNSVDRDHCSG